MVKLTKWEKQELLKIYKQDRKDLRCLVVQDLTKKAKELTKQELLKIYKQDRKDLRCLVVQNLTKKAKELTSDLIISIANVKDELHRLEIEQICILKENNLQDFDNTTDYTLKTTLLHQRLILFDRETNTEIQKIIREG